MTPIDSHQGDIHRADKHVDEGKGRIKEAAGSLTGDRSLKNEGKVDRGKATVKDMVDKVADALSGRHKK
ncbi:MAG: CsbD family protein [Solirubrobacteraceae bacterium]